MTYTDQLIENLKHDNREAELLGVRPLADGTSIVRVQETMKKTSTRFHCVVLDEVLASYREVGSSERNKLATLAKCKARKT
jgi:hypothetical protein